MHGAIAAGHPLTAEAGARVLREGGNAVDALLAAVFTAFVCEGPLTGPAAGGFLLVRTSEGEATFLDCFFGVPETRLGEMEELVIDFADAGTQVFHVGPGSVAVPGLLAGLEMAHRRFASREWAPLADSALVLAHGGFERDEPRQFLHSILAGVLLRDEGGRSIYGDAARVVTADCCATLESVRDLGADAAAELLPEFADDFASYEVLERPPLAAAVRGYETLAMPTRGGGVVLEILEHLGDAGEPALADFARAVAAGYGSLGAGPLPGTTHISVIDGRGMAAALSSTLGSGSGVFRAGTQLNNMLGELDVIGHDEKQPGERLPSMMAPTLVLDSGGPRLVVGSAGSVRLAGAIAQVVWRTLAGSDVTDAIRSPRVHVDGTTLHLEGGWPEADVTTLPAEWDVNRWEGINLFFGGAQAVERMPNGRLRAAGDPRRGGVGLVVS